MFDWLSMKRKTSFDDLIIFFFSSHLGSMFAKRYKNIHRLFFFVSYSFCNHKIITAISAHNALSFTAFRVVCNTPMGVNERACRSFRAKT
jgi:hypothetical protein